MGKVPFAPKPDKRIMENVKLDYPRVAAYIAYLEDLDKVTSERARPAELALKKKKCQHYFVHNSRCVECGKEGVS